MHRTIMCMLYNDCVLGMGMGNYYIEYRLNVRAMVDENGYDRFVSYTFFSRNFFLNIVSKAKIEHWAFTYSHALSCVYIVTHLIYKDQMPVMWQFVQFRSYSNCHSLALHLVNEFLSRARARFIIGWRFSSHQTAVCHESVCRIVSFIMAVIKNHIQLYLIFLCA